ncbi:MAG: alpha-hydroxy-acid oxidizing protein [Pyramidobacter sp.]|jgi:isopentenyl diphosphate isomerase/L-lactate dehydrogenase-like FMN-dependent dehydrogenase
MTYDEVLQNARTCIGPHCKACPVCNGRACGNAMPGPGSKGDVAVRNYSMWQHIRINMNTIARGGEPDTSFNFYGCRMKYPVFVGPVGAVKLHYGDKYDDIQYNEVILSACAEEGIAGFTGDGTNPDVMKAATAAIKRQNGIGIPTVKPWDVNTLHEKFALVKESGAVAVAMDIDAAGLPFLQGLTPAAGSKTVDELREIIAEAGRPFFIKGVMTVSGALAAKAAGAAGIIVSNHGGRVLDQTPSTAEVLPEIADAVKGSMKVLVDGGLRSGADIFKALALGADAVLIARPYVTAAYGGGREGVKLYTEKLGRELRDTMKMCGVLSLSEISRANLYKPSNPYIAL